ncbi:GGDEF domain-containing protein [Ruminococcus sp.]|uniref:sensor domain-containing diguanylate cyclase n=1 Tax=Ruminococcus sp. TaxID=41978 RepID=UPI0025D669D7|nr:GGDEF domain-containing protein [Ruminococcus sp.]MCR4639627.1 GGDEF domain-containing protein [Ruminococcus sp.]
MKKHDKSPISFASLALALANDYCNIYVINAENDSYVEYSPIGADKELVQISSGKNFYEAVPHNCRELVYKDDQEFFLKAFKKSSVTQALENGHSFSLTYRLVIDGVPRYFFLKTIRSDDRSIIVGVRDIDAEKRKELEAEKNSRTYAEIATSLASLFEIIYHVDLDTGSYTEYSSSEAFTKQGFASDGDDFFERAEVDMKRVIHPDDREKILSEMKKETLISNLHSAGTVSLTYRQLIDEKYHYMNLLAFIQKNAEKEHLIIGVRNIDAEKKREAQSRNFSDIALALAKRYEVIYLVNTITNEYIEYSASEKYRKLKVGTTGKDFFAESQVNMKRDIYEPDLPMMSKIMQKENLLSSISAYGKLPVNYRLILEGRPQYVTLYAVRPQDDSDHIIIAVANIDEAMQKEFAYQDMANKDSLTGVKNKRAYAQAETELDGLIAKCTQPPFAILVCDINGLKEVNDTNGHNAGDNFICSACSIICNIFKHSPVFRIGGDEFAVIMKDSDYDERTHLMNELNKALENNKRSGMVILAAGISDFDPDMDIRVQDVFERADNLMYENKKKCKASALKK